MNYLNLLLAYYVFILFVPALICVFRLALIIVESTINYCNTEKFSFPLNYSLNKLILSLILTTLMLLSNCLIYQELDENSNYFYIIFLIILLTIIQSHLFYILDKKFPRSTIIFFRDFVVSGKILIFEFNEEIVIDSNQLALDFNLFKIMVNDSKKEILEKLDKLKVTEFQIKYKNLFKELNRDILDSPFKVNKFIEENECKDSFYNLVYNKVMPSNKIQLLVNVRGDGDNKQYDKKELIHFLDLYFNLKKLCINDKTFKTEYLKFFNDNFLINNGESGFNTCDFKRNLKK